MRDAHSENGLPIARRITLALALVVILKTTASSTTTDEQQVINATIAAVKLRFAPTSVVPKVAAFTLSGNYALTTWGFGKGGGSAALRKQGNTWSVIAMGGGGMQTSTLISFGVPTNVAATLAATISPLPSPSP